MNRAGRQVARFEHHSPGEEGRPTAAPIHGVVRDPGEVPLRLHSQLRGPISELDFLRRSLLMAELAMIAYNDEDEARRAYSVIGFPDTSFYDRDGSQAYRVRNEYDCVVACRGTEPNEWNDIQADAKVGSVLAETAGRVHRGFKREVDDLWPMLETALMGSDQPLWFCGHSLGGAMATICAGRCYLSHIESNPSELYTFGSPRVGNHRYVNFVKLKHYRFVNNNDIVTRVPPAWLGYRHCGTEIYLDHLGRIRDLRGAERRLDRVAGFVKALRRWRLDHFADHSIHRYIEVLALAALEAENNREATENEDGRACDPNETLLPVEWRDPGVADYRRDAPHARMNRAKSAGDRSVEDSSATAGRPPQPPHWSES